MIALIFPIPSPSKISLYNYVKIDNIKYIKNEKINNVWNFIEKVNDSEKQTNLEFKNRVSNNMTKISKSYYEAIFANIWFTVCLLSMIRNIYSYGALNRLIGNDEFTDERVIKIFELCKKRLKINRQINLIKQDLVKSPSIMGVFHMKILLTDAILELDDLAITDIFMHELSHYKRKDNILNFAIMILKSIYWFNPFLSKIFKNIKSDVELATDEMAISEMDKDEQREYCKVIVEVSEMCSSRIKHALGLADDVKTLEKRINMISLKNKFEKNSKIIFAVTIFIVLLIWFILYPTSYGMFDVPKLYLKLEDGTMVQASTMSNKDNFECETIYINKNSKLELITEGGNNEKYISCCKIDLSNEKMDEEISSISSRKLEYFQAGEYIYQFTIEYGKNKSIDYAVKFVVE